MIQLVKQRQYDNTGGYLGMDHKLIESCCEEFSNLYNLSYNLVEYNDIGNLFQFTVSPRFSDEMVTIEIKHCPFCGKKLDIQLLERE